MLVDSDSYHLTLEHVATASMPHAGAGAALAGAGKHLAIKDSTKGIVDRLRAVVGSFDFATDANSDKVATGKRLLTNKVYDFGTCIVTRRDVQLIVDRHISAGFNEALQQSEALAVAVGFDIRQHCQGLHPKFNVVDIGKVSVNVETEIEPCRVLSDNITHCTQNRSAIKAHQIRILCLTEKR